MPTVQAQPSADNEQLRNELKRFKQRTLQIAKTTFPLLRNLNGTGWTRVQNTLDNYGTASDADKLFTANVMGAMAIIAAALQVLENNE